MKYTVFYNISESQYRFEHPEYAKWGVTAEQWLNYVENEDCSFVPVVLNDRANYALDLWHILKVFRDGVVFLRDLDNRIDWKIETSIPLDPNYSLKKRKENNKMPENKICSEFVTETDAQHNRCMTEIQTELEKDIADAHKKAAAATEVENDYYEKAKIRKEYELMAYKQRTYYEELVKAGFTEDQAWEMTKIPIFNYSPSWGT